MAARPSILAVPKSLYKHFAVLTVVATACVAMFAEGAKNDRVDQRIAAPRKAKAPQVQKAELDHQRKVSGLKDNRTYVVNGNSDVGAMPVSPQESSIFPVQEWPEWGLNELPSKEALARRRKASRELPPVLPPGMKPFPGMPDTDATTARPSGV